VIVPLFALLIGLLIGSFLNVCIYRWPLDLSVVRPRSHCTSCDKMIAWYDNIPVLSYIILAGRCRYCRTHISMRYPIVELATGALFFYFVDTLGLTVAAARMCCFTAMLVALVFTDLEERILPDEFTVGGAVLGVVFAFFVPVPDITAAALFWLAGAELHAPWVWVAESLTGALLPALFLWGGGWLYFKIRHREGLGFGDVKLIAMVGSFMGLRGALFTLIVGSVAGSILGFGYIKLTRKDPSTYELPFGTFLGVAALAAAIFGKGWLNP
jgi:leader peptidase (prepilin peptidase)/N-methyltransferase